MFASGWGGTRCPGSFTGELKLPVVAVFDAFKHSAAKCGGVFGAPTEKSAHIVTLGEPAGDAA